MPKNIYLDVDGVILTRGVTPALHLDEFLRYILGKYTVYWLSSRCQGGSKSIIEYLSQFFFPDTIDLLRKIKITNYRIDKTEAIDFSEEFFWLDDDLFASEKNALKQHNQYNSWIEVNLIKNPNQLNDLISNKFRLKA